MFRRALVVSKGGVSRATSLASSIQ